MYLFSRTDTRLFWNEFFVHPLPPSTRTEYLISDGGTISPSGHSVVGSHQGRNGKSRNNVLSKSEGLGVKRINIFSVSLLSKRNTKGTLPCFCVQTNQGTHIPWYKTLSNRLGTTSYWRHNPLYRYYTFDGWNGSEGSGSNSIFVVTSSGSFLGHSNLLS